MRREVVISTPGVDGGRGLRVVVFDVRHAARESLRRLLLTRQDVDQVEMVRDERAALDAAAGDEVDLVLVGLRDLPAARVRDVIDAVAHRRGGAPVLLVGAPDEVVQLTRAVTSGPVGIMAGTAGTHSVADAVEVIARGEAVLPGEVVAPYISRLNGERRRREHNDEVLAALTERERTVLEMFAAGMRRVEIAERLGLSPNTVRTHLSHVMQKLGVSSVVEVAVKGRELLGRVPPAVITLPDPRAEPVHSRR